MENLQYTVDGNFFTPEQRAFYEENGFIIIRKLINEDVINGCIQRFLDYCNGKVKTHGVTIMKDKGVKSKDPKLPNEYKIFKIQDFNFDDDLFKLYACNPEIIKVVRNIVGLNVTAINTMLINKPPNSRLEFSAHPTHQDLYYFPFRPADSCCASWSALEACTMENGCLYVVPGSHRNNLLPHVYLYDLKNKSYEGIQNVDERLKVYIPMDKGDTVFFHPLLLHGSGPNKTERFRKIISVHYIDSNSYFINVRGTIQEDIQKELEEIYAKKGILASHTDIWKYKSRLVCGRPGNFQRISSQL